MSGGEQTVVQPTIDISPVTGGYRLQGTVNGVGVTLLVDTGAAVTLLRKDVWSQTTTTAKLEPWPGPSLVSAGGTPLTVHGCTHLDLSLGGNTFSTNFVIVSPLTSEAILGIDFLQEQQAQIDLGRGSLSLLKNGSNIRLTLPITGLPSTIPHQVRIRDTVSIPPRSVMDVAAVCTTWGEGLWMVEEAPHRYPGLVVASILVENRPASLPVSVLNMSTSSITLYAGSVVAKVSPVQSPLVVGEIDKRGNNQISSEKRQLLWELAQESGTKRKSSEQEIFHELLLRHADVFASSTTDLGRTNKLRHQIDIGGSPPIRQAVRRISPHRRDEVRRLLQQMLEGDVIEPSSSPWASPVVLVQKKDGSIRFCVDYRKLNEWFSTLDLVSGYWQVELEETAKEKTAFCTTEGLQWSQCLVYLDDIIILGRSFEDHVQNLDTVFQRLRQAGLRLKPGKCAFFKEEVQYLGHIISREGVRTDPAKTAKVAGWSTPTNKKEVKQFIGFANYYRRFIKDFAQIARPLHQLTENSTSFNWTADCQEAFDQLRKQLCSTPILAFPNFNEPFILDTDASDVGIGGVLSQLDSEGRERPVAYGSRILTKPERRYCVTRRELLAVVTFIQMYRPYLAGRKFMLRTDHGSLTWLRNFKEPEGQLARWLERLQELEFDIVHRPGKAHCNADALSRLPCN